MAASLHIPLTPELVAPNHPDYQALLGWPYPAQPFYVGQVLSLLRRDVVIRHAAGRCMFWVYRDPDGVVVGFGSLDDSTEYGRYTQNRSHLYIPVLGVHPDHGGKGHGRSITEHLVRVAGVLCPTGADYSDVVFLDVYRANTPAIRLYQNKCGFDILNPDAPIPDPDQNGEPYYVMARRLGSVADQPGG